MFTAANRVGRLIEVRLDEGGTLPDHQMLNSKVYALLSRMSGGGVFITDMRKLEALTDELAKRMADSYRKANVKVARTALVVREASRLRGQLETIVRDAGGGARRVFTSAAAAEAWLGEVLDATESARVAAFLAEG